MANLIDEGDIVYYRVTYEKGIVTAIGDETGVVTYFICWKNGSESIHVKDEFYTKKEYLAIKRNQL